MELADTQSSGGCPRKGVEVQVLSCPPDWDMDISKITDPQAKAFIGQFLKDREINKEFYRRVPEDKFDFRMVDTP